MTVWLKYCRETGDAQARVFCFHHAGGSALAFRDWVRAAPAELDICPVQLPGREERLREAPLRRMTDLAANLADALATRLDLPFVFFGHSMGAKLAFATTLELARRRAPTPHRLFVAASRAPQLQRGDIPMHSLPEPAFRAKLKAIGGMSDAVLASKELMAMVLPILRADFEAIETYRPSEEDRIPCGISAIVAQSDAQATRATMESWAHMTTGDFDLRETRGNHFFLRYQSQELIQDIGRVLFSALARSSPGATHK